MKKIIVLVVVAGLVVLYFATRSAVMHDVPWYASHSVERAAAQEACHISAERADTAACQNAEAADLDVALGPNELFDLRNPAYWSDHRSERANVLAQCARPNDPGNARMLPYCDAVRRSINQDGSH